MFVLIGSLFHICTIFVVYLFDIQPDDTEDPDDHGDYECPDDPDDHGSSDDPDDPDDLDDHNSKLSGVIKASQ